MPVLVPHAYHNVAKLTHHHKCRGRGKQRHDCLVQLAYLSTLALVLATYAAILVALTNDMR